jgi:hypothetical protein
MIIITSGKIHRWILKQWAQVGGERGYFQDLKNSSPKKSVHFKGENNSFTA